MIRKITENDKQAFLALEKEFYSSEAVLHPIPPQYHENTFNELMRSEDYLICYIVEDEGKALGYALLSRSFSPEAGGKIVWIEELYIRADYRGKGTGHQLFKVIERDYPAARYRLEVEPDNISAKRLYCKMGYKQLCYEQMIKDMK